MKFGRVIKAIKAAWSRLRDKLPLHSPDCGGELKSAFCAPLTKHIVYVNTANTENTGFEKGGTTMKYIETKLTEQTGKWSLPLYVNQGLKTDKPSVSQDMVDSFIKDIEVVTVGGKNTVVRAVLRNGFELVESSACVSVENYDKMLGAEICLKKIKDKVWMLLGFLLQTAVNGVTEDDDGE